MKKRKLILIVAAALALVIAAGIAFVLTNVNFIVKSAIEKYGSRATGTAVAVSSVNIRLASGEAEVMGLSVANPGGFSSPHIFDLGSIAVRIDARSVARSPWWSPRSASAVPRSSTK